MAWRYATVLIAAAVLLVVAVMRFTPPASSCADVTKPGDTFDLIAARERYVQAASEKVDGCAEAAAAAEQTICAQLLTLAPARGDELLKSEDMRAIQLRCTVTEGVTP